MQNNVIDVSRSTDYFTSMASYHIINGQLVSEAQLVIPARDLGLIRGYGAFDFLITYKRRPFHLKEHIDRLYDSAEIIEIEIPWEKSQVMSWVHQAMEANSDGLEKSIRLVVTGGVSEDAILPVSGRANLLVMIDPHRPYPKNYYEQGVKVLTHKYFRNFSRAKSTDYIEAVKQMKRVKSQGALEVIYHDDRQVFEGATSNIYAFNGKKIFTPLTNVLSGVTREVLLRLHDASIPLVEQDFSLEDLWNAKEVFITASNKEVMPVTHIDDRRVGDGLVGPMTQKVMKKFRDYTQSNLW